jgi:tetratricopeptide (TPR) repeat protein
MTFGGRLLLVVLIGVVLNEGHAKICYERSLKQLTALAGAAHDHDRDLTLDEAVATVAGLPTRNRRFNLERPVEIVQWFSLFKTYAIEIHVDDDNVVSRVQTPGDFAPVYTTKPVSTEQFLKNLPGGGGLIFRPGTEEGDRSVVQLLESSVDEKWQGNSFRPVTLYAELFRQSFLIAARDELQLQTRDAGLGEDLYEAQGPLEWPFQIVVSNILYQPEAGLTVEVRRPNGPPVPVEKREINLPNGFTADQVVAAAEQLSRTWLVDVLRAHDFAGKPNPRADTGKVGPDIEARLGSAYAISLIAAVREIHAQMASQGESPERLAQLAWGYALLGEAGRFTTSNMQASCQARALLYAERLHIQFPDEPLSQLARARVRALIGLHPSAREILATVRRNVPKAELAALQFRFWHPALDEFLLHDYAALSKRMKSSGDLTTLLCNLQVAEAKQQHDQIRAVTDAILYRFPGQALAMQRSGLGGGMAVKSEQSNEGLNAFTKAFRGELQTWRDLPEAVTSIANENPFTFAGRVDQRIRLVEELRQSSALGKDRSEPSLALLAGFLREVNFTEACRIVEFERGTLYVDSDDTMEKVKDLVEGHPFADYFHSLVWDASLGFYKAKNLMLVRFWPRLNRNCFNMVRFMRSWGEMNSRNRKKLLELHSSLAPTFSDQAWNVLNHLEREGKVEALNRLKELAPASPVTIAARIRLDWPNERQHAENWEQTYAGSADVLRELSEAYRLSFEPQAARRCLKKSMAISPGPTRTAMMAQLDLDEGNEAAWKSGLEKAGRESGGLGEAMYQSQIARYLMSKGRPDEALPHARIAAGTYSKWGLICMADCCEMLGRMDEALDYHTKASKRYGPNLDVYFWCHKTGHGDPDEIERALGEWMTGLLKAIDEKSRAKAAVISILKGRRVQAVTEFRESQGYFERLQGNSYPITYQLGVFPFVQRILLIDELVPEVALKEYSQDIDIVKVADDMVGTAKICDVNESLSITPFRLICEIRDVVTQDKSSGSRVDLDRMDWLIGMDGENGNRTNSWYIVGRLLLNEGRKEEALPYLQLAATSSLNRTFSATLAAATLRQLGEPVGRLRPTEVPSEMAEVMQLLDFAISWRHVGDFERAHLRLDRIEKQKPDWPMAIAERAYTFLGERKFKEAEKCLTRAIELQSKIPELWSMRGLVRTRLGRYHEAISDYEQALKGNPQDRFAHWCLGMMRVACPDDDIRNLEKAKQHLARVEDVMSSRVPIAGRYQLKAAIMAEEGNFEDALRYWGWNRQSQLPREEVIEIQEGFRDKKPYRFKTYVKEPD